MKKRNINGLMLNMALLACFPHYSDGADTAAAPVDDILTNSLDDVDTRNPLLNKGKYKFIVHKVEQKTNDTKNTKRIAIQLKLNQTAVSVDGQQLHQGAMFFDQVAITPTEKYSADDIKKALKRFQEGCGVTGAFHPLERYEGREVEADVTISPAKGDYQEANRFKYVKKA